MLQSRKAEQEEVQTLGLRFRLYEPESPADERVGVFFVHGRAGSDESMWIFSRTLQKQKPFIFAPQAPLQDPHGGWSWWDIFEPGGERIRRTTWEGLLPAVDALENFVEAAVERFSLSPHKIFAAGFSQGGAVATALSLRRPELFRGVAVLSSFLPAIVYEEPERLPLAPSAQKRPRYFIFHGTADPIVPADRAEKLADYLGNLGADVRLEQEDVKHKVGMRGMRALQEWFAETTAADS